MMIKVGTIKAEKQNRQANHRLATRVCFSANLACAFSLTRGAL